MVAVSSPLKQGQEETLRLPMVHHLFKKPVTGFPHAPSTPLLAEKVQSANLVQSRARRTGGPERFAAEP
jgi:hypothetical protein